MSVEIDLRIEASAWSDAISDVEDLCARALEAGAAVAKAAGEIDVLLTDATEMTSLNAAWRGKNRPTDVLSFPADPIDAPHLGSVAIGFSTAKSDAAADGKSLDEHFAHLLIHGFLHLLGYDHQTDDDASVMEDLERDALARLGVADPYKISDIQ